ncbi:MAG: WD40 repeat domain-containing protein [Gemmataceae bacterium]
MATAPSTSCALDPTPAPPAPRRPAAGSLDELRRQDIAADELALAGGGDAAKAPAELVAVVGTGRLRHWGKLHGLTFTADGKQLLSGSQDGSVRLWDAATGRLIDSTSTQGAGLYAVVAPPGGGPRIVVTRFDRKPDRPIDTRTTAWHTLQPSFALRSDGSLVAGGGGNTRVVSLWPAASGKAEQFAQAEEGYQLAAVAFSPDGTLLAVAWSRATPSSSVVQVWDVASRQLRHALRNDNKSGDGRCEALAFTADGKSLVTGYRTGAVKFWDPATGKERRTVQAAGAVQTLALSRDGQWLATAGEDQARVELHELAGGNRFMLPLGIAGNLPRLAFSPDGATLAVGTAAGELRLWDVATRRERLRSTSETGFPAGLAVAADCRTMAVRLSDGPVTLHDLVDGKVKKTFGVPEVAYRPNFASRLHPVALRSDGRAVAATWPWNTLCVWDVPTGGLHQAPVPGGPSVTALAFRPNSPEVAVIAGTQRVHLWTSAQDRKPRWTWQPAGTDVHALAFSADGTTVAVTCTTRSDRWVQLLNAETGTPIRQLKGGTVRSTTCVPAFSADGTLLACAAVGIPDASVLVWDVATGEERFRLPVLPARGPDLVTAHGVAFRPDGRLLAVAMDDGSVRLWDVSAPAGPPRLVRTFSSPPTGRVGQVFFAPDGRHLLTLNGNGTVYVLRLDPPQARRRQWRDHRAARPGRAGGAPANCRSDQLDAGDGRPSRDGRDGGVQPGGEWLASGGDDGNVRVWNAPGTLHRLLVRHSSASTAWPGRPTASTWRRSAAATARPPASGRWTPASWCGRCPSPATPSPGRPTAPSWRSVKESIRIYKTADWAEERSVKAAPPVWRIGWSPDGKQLAAIVRYDSAVLRWDAAGQPLPPLKVDAAGLLAAGLVARRQAAGRRRQRQEGADLGRRRQAGSHRRGRRSGQRPGVVARQHGRRLARVVHRVLAGRRR